MKRPPVIWISPGSAESLVERPGLAVGVWGIDAFDGLIPYSLVNESREAAVEELVKVVRWVVSKDWQYAAVPAAYLQGLQRALDSVDAIDEAD